MKFKLRDKVIIKLFTHYNKGIVIGTRIAGHSTGITERTYQVMCQVLDNSQGFVTVGSRTYTIDEKDLELDIQVFLESLSPVTASHADLPDLPDLPCDHVWLTYDSGWSRYEYCKHCNVKKEENG